MRLRLRLLACILMLSFTYAQNIYAQGFVNDIDGNSYPTVVIGAQEWLGENLKVTRYNNGDPILTNQTHNQWRFATEGIWTNYDNNPANDPLYGKFYNWFATADPRGLCPAGWRVPTDNDWDILTEFIDSDAWGNFNSLGANLKSRRQVNTPFGGEFNTSDHPRWDSHPKIYGVDAYGFGALPGGYYTMGSAFVHFGQYAYFWSSTERDNGQVWVRSLKNSNTGVSRGQFIKNTGISVRCVKGEVQIIQVPEVITLKPTGITTTSAVCGGEVLQDGGSPVTGRGLVWGTLPNPTIDDNLGLVASGSGLGVFTETISGLDLGSTYWVRAYATNEAGTAYGIQKKIATIVEVGAPTLSTRAVSNITDTTAISGGVFSSDGGAFVTARGVVWSTAQNPTLENNEGFTNDGEGSGTFYSTITNLDPASSYYLRAYATNSVGTSYGNVRFFTTQGGSNDNCLVLWYPFNGNAIEETGLGNNGQVNGATLTEDRFGNLNSAYHFNGINDNITIPGNLPITNSFTISFWAYSEKESGTANVLTDGSINIGGNDFLINFRGNSIGIRADKSGKSLNYEYSSPAELNNLNLLNRWVHVAWVMNPTGSLIYVDGLLKSTINVPGTNEGYYDDHITIGARHVWTNMDDFFKGKLDDFRIFNCELTANEIFDIFIEEGYYIPTLNTSEVTNIKSTTAVSGGNITSDGGSQITSRGVVWSTSQNPTLENNDGFTVDGDGAGVFTSSLSNLTPETTYYVRAYAANSAGNFYGEQKTFETQGAKNSIIILDSNAEAGSQITIEVEMLNQGDITAFQMDFELPDGFSYVEGSYSLSSRSQGHTPGQSILTNGKLRLLAYSATNNVFLGNSGILFTFKLNTPAQAGTWNIEPTNVILTNTDFENVFDGADGGILMLNQATVLNSNKYFFRDTTASNTGGNGYFALHTGYEINEITNTFSFDFWVKPTRSITMVSESNACSGDVSVPLAYSNQNWALVPNAPSLHMAVGLTIGTNGLMIGEHSGNILVSRLSYSIDITDWVHVAVVYQPDMIFLFLNGDLVRSRPRPCPNSDRYITAGLTGYYYSPDFKGNFDEFRLWDIALTQEQVSIVKDKKLMSPVLGLRYYASFDEGVFERTLGDIGDLNMTVNGNITPEANIKESDWDLERHTGETIETLVPF